MKNIEKNDYYQEVFIGLTLSAFLGTIALFFAGLLIAQINSFNNSIRMPIIFLVVSTMSFIFSSLLYSNASGQTTGENWEAVLKHNSTANVISEFLGVYLFIGAIPMVINAVTTDSLLRVAIAVISVGTLFLYSASSFAILNRLVKRTTQWILSTLMVVTFSGLLYAQTQSLAIFFTAGVSVLVLSLLTTLLLLAKR